MSKSDPKVSAVVFDFMSKLTFIMGIIEVKIFCDLMLGLYNRLRELKKRVNHQEEFIFIIGETKVWGLVKIKEYQVSVELTAITEDEGDMKC